MNTKELRDQLDQIARLEEKAMQMKWDMLAIVLEENVALANALVNFWRSGGRELAERAIELEHAAWHVCESSTENATTGEITVDRSDFEKLSSLLPEDHPGNDADRAKESDQ